MSLDVALARLARRVPRFRGWHRLLEPLRRHFVRVYRGRADRWIVIDDFEGDLRFRVDRSAHMSSLIYWRGIHAYREACLIRRHLPVDGVFLDVGANQGELTLVAARRARHGRVVAFEPVHRWFALLAENVRLNDLAHVTLVHAALADRDGEAEMFTAADRRVQGAENEGLASLVPAAGRELRLGPVRTLTLDGYAAGAGLTRVDMIKIDVEGAEAAVLGGGAETVARCRPQLILEWGTPGAAAGGSPVELLDWLRARGYRLFAVDPFARLSPVAARPRPGTDTLFARHATAH